MNSTHLQQSQGKYLEANGIRIFYQEMGSGPPLILLHGATDTHLLWRPHLPALTEHFRVITPDTRGHGLTLNPSRQLSYRTLGDDLAGIIRALDLERPYIFGYSDGGQAALDLSLRYPDLPGALVIGGVWYRFSREYRAAITAAGFEEPGLVNWEVYLRQARRDWQEHLRRAHSDPDPDYPRQLLEGLARMWWQPMNYHPEDFKSISAPTLVLIGEQDEFIPLAEARELSALIPGGELSVIPGARHDQVLIEGGIFLSSVISFLIRQLPQQRRFGADRPGSTF